VLFWHNAESKAEKNLLFLTKRNSNKELEAEDSATNNSPQATFRFTLGKQERLKSKKIVDELFNNGSSFFLQPIRVIYKYEKWGDIFPCKVAFTVSKRNFKKAVDRNRVKRLLREAYRINKKPLYDFLKLQDKQMAIAFIYTSNQLPEYETVNLTVQKIIKKLTEDK
jgi:ribonuclease P protein component